MKTYEFTLKQPDGSIKKVIKTKKDKMTGADFERIKAAFRKSRRGECIKCREIATGKTKN